MEYKLNILQDIIHRRYGNGFLIVGIATQHYYRRYDLTIRDLTIRDKNNMITYNQFPLGYDYHISVSRQTYNEYYIKLRDEKINTILEDGI